MMKTISVSMSIDDWHGEVALLNQEIENVRPKIRIVEDFFGDDAVDLPAGPQRENFEALKQWLADCERRRESILRQMAKAVLG